MSQSERIFYILRFLDREGGISTKDVVRAFEVSERQAKRDIEYMRDRLGAPIVWKRETGRYEYSGPWSDPWGGSRLPPDFPYRAAFDAASVGFLVVSRRDGTILMANRAIEAILGVPGHALLGRRPEETGMNPEAVERAKALLAAHPDKPLTIEDGGRNYLVSQSDFPCEGTDCVIFLVKDISDMVVVGKAPTVEELRAHESLGTARKRILVVDDDDMVLRMLGCLVSALGYEPSLASSAKNALGILSNRDHCFDLVLLDIMMPEMDGIELFKRIQDACPGMPCLFLSGFSPKPLSDVLSLPAARGFIQKPVSRADLQEALARAIEGERVFKGSFTQP